MGKDLTFGSRPLRTSVVPRLRITIPIRIVPGDGGWVLERFAVTFVNNGRTLDATRRTPFPERSTKPFQTRLVYEMDQCRFVRQYRQQDHTVSCGLDADGEERTTAPDYDWDDFRSFMTIFRKVGIAEGEPTHLAKIYKLIGRYARVKK